MSFKSATATDSIRVRRKVHTLPCDLLREVLICPDYSPMAKRDPSKGRIEKLIKEAARPYPELWWEDDRLNFEALARFFKARGRKIPSATLYRICTGEHRQPSERIVEAINHVLRIPKELLRGEELSPAMAKAFGDYRLSTLILAEKIEELPRGEYARLVEQIDAILDRENRLREALESDKVVHIDKHRR